MSSGVSRREFLALGGALGLGAALGPRWAAAGPGTPTLLRAGGGEFDEATVAGLQQAMESGEASSERITSWYLGQIDDRNRMLNALLEANPDALAIARGRDRERADGRIRGPLHGVPVVLKDNIDTDDRTQTTAGSLALLGAGVARDATLVARLREAGAVVLGKANLSEWSNFRTDTPINGWSARGGFTRNPYRLDTDPGGSSSGSAVAVAANLAALAVGTDTDGSISYPAGLNNAVGLDPTVGLISQRGIIPIGASFDSAGPLTRTVTDAAILLAVLRSPFAGGPHTPPADLPTDYRPFLTSDALQGARIGVDPFYLDAAAQGGAEDKAQYDLADALDALREAGATIVDDVDTANVLTFFGDEFTMFLFEFKAQIAAYLRTRTGTKRRSLADLIEFNTEKCRAELKYFGQEIFEASQATSGDLNDREYLRAKRRLRRIVRPEGIDAAFAKHRLDAVVGPSFSFISSPPACAGYPNITVPAGFDPDGRPKGMLLYGLPWQEGKLLGYAFAFEQVMDVRRAPAFQGQVPPEPPRFDGCAPKAGPESCATDSGVGFLGSGTGAASGARPMRRRPGC